MKQFFHRHQPEVHVRVALLAGAGAALAITLLGLLAQWSGLAWLAAFFGASCVLLFAAPAAPFSQPANLVGGHCVSALVGVALAAALPGEFWVAGMAVGLSVSAMMWLRVVHPPAGGTVLVAYLTQAGWGFVLFPVLAGSLVLVAFAWGYHSLAGAKYPLSPAK